MPVSESATSQPEYLPPTDSVGSLPPQMEGGYDFTCVCLYVCLSVCLFFRVLKKLWTILMEFFGAVGHGPRILWLDFGSNQDPGIFYTILYLLLAVITRPPDGVLLAPSALAARRLRRLACYSNCITRRPDGVS